MRAIALLLSLTVVTSGALARDVNRTITAVPGIRVGHHTLTERPTVWPSRFVSELLTQLPSAPSCDVLIVSVVCPS